jgi:ABC-type multidrug transport system fused ATPase/permease subunit
VTVETSKFAFFVRLLRPQRGRVLAAMAVATGESLLMLSLPWFAGQVAAGLLAAELSPSLLGAWVLVLAVQTVLTIANARVLGALGARLGAELGTRVFEHLQSLPLRWHQARRRGDVLSLLDNDVWRIGGFLTGTVTLLLPMLLTFVGALIMLLRLEPRLGLAIIALVPVYVLALKLVGRRLRPLETGYNQAYASRYAHAAQALATLPLAKAFTREPAASAHYARLSAEVRDQELEQLRLESMLAPVVRLLTACVVIVLLWLAAGQVARGELQAPVLVSLLLYGMLLTQPVAQLAGLYGRSQLAGGAARRLLELFAAAPEPDDGQRAPETVAGAIRFESVAFAYPGRPPLYSALDLEIRAGETVAITGVNGAGKSTLAHLLLRFADPQQGRITLDGIDLREFRLANLRGHIGLVSQHVLLLNDTVAANIGYGRLTADRAAIEAAARAAHAHAFIERLPQGYDTVIGDEGTRLSGGQRQRLALARALLKGPAILILDEATAMFDPDGERDFLSECHALLRERTVLLITHRPASLALADRVLRLEDGTLRAA